MAVIGCAGADESAAALSANEFVASCIHIGERESPPTAVLCRGRTDGSLELSDVAVEPGIKPVIALERDRVAAKEGDRLVIRETVGWDEIVSFESSAVGFDWEPDGRSLVFVDADGAVGRVRVGNDGPQETVILPQDPAGVRLGRTISVSHDGKSAAVDFEDDDGHGLAMIDLTTGKLAVLLRSDEPVAWPVWSPSDRRLAVVVGDLINLVTESGSTEPLVQTGRPVTAPSWSPDGSEVMFVDSRGVLATVSMELGPSLVVLDLSGDPGAQRFPALPSWT